MELQKYVTVDCYCPSEPCVRIIDPQLCATGCLRECLYVCPAGLFIDVRGTVITDHAGACLECGACRLVCNNIDFDYPSAGGGIVHRFG